MDTQISCGLLTGRVASQWASGRIAVTWLEPISLSVAKLPFFPTI